MLNIYYKNSEDQFVLVSRTGDLISPITTVHDGKLGDLSTIQLYLNNDDANLWFSNINVLPVDKVDANPYGDVSSVETGWGVKLSSGAAEPTRGQWGDIAWGNEIILGNIGSDISGDIATYSPFWYLISCPPNTNAQVKTDIVVKVSYTQNSVIPVP